MTYHIARFLLACVQGFAFREVHARDLGYPFWFSLYAIGSALFNAFPAFPRALWWQSWVQFPYVVISLPLMIAATVELFAFLPRRTFPQERKLLLVGSVVAGCLPVSLARGGTPEDTYQVVMIVRQYLLVALATAGASAWWWVTRRRTLQIPPQVRVHGNLWCLWLALAAVLSATTKGGLVWQVLPWRGGLWRDLVNALLIGQVLVMSGIWWNLRGWRKV